MTTLPVFVPVASRTSDYAGNKRMSVFWGINGRVCVPSEWTSALAHSRGGIGIVHQKHTRFGLELVPRDALTKSASHSPVLLQ